MNQAAKAMITTITPDRAAAWLRKMDKNRALSMRQVNKLAADMKAGQWSLNGQTIKFNRDGKLFDGQHRLQAVMKSGCAIQSYVVFGIDDPNAFQTVDYNQKSRDASQILGIMGLKNTTILAAIARRLLAWELTPEKHTFSLTSLLFKTLHQKDVVKYAETHAEEIGHMVGEVASSLPYRKCKAPSAFAASLILCNRLDDVATYLFVDDLKTGANLSKGSSIMLLRDRMIMPPERGGHGWETELMALVIKAWNYVYKGKPMRNLRWRQSGNSPERFPMPGVLRQ